MSKVVLSYLIITDYFRCKQTITWKSRFQLQKIRKKIQRSLQSIFISNKKIGLNKESVDFEKVKKAHLFVVAGPKEQFAPNEIADMKRLVESGGKLLILAN